MAKAKKDPNANLIKELKKKVNFRSDPSTCENCKLRDESSMCTMFKEAVLFPVELDTSCDNWTRKPKKYTKKVATETAEKAPEETKVDEKKTATKKVVKKTKPAK